MVLNPGPGQELKGEVVHYNSLREHNAGLHRPKQELHQAVLAFVRKTFPNANPCRASLLLSPFALSKSKEQVSILLI